MTVPATTSGCPVDALLRLLSGPWTTYILWLLRQNGAQRFGELRRAMPGISAKVLTERLRRLEGAGVVWREQLATIPPQVRYGLTERGDDLGAVLDGLATIARRWESEGVVEGPGSPVGRGDGGAGDGRG